MALLVRVEKADGTVQRAGFNYSPVRIGRNPLNELYLEDGVVSQWHALVRFDEIEGHITVMDLGSTNGTAFNGTLLRPHMPVAVSRNDVLNLGPIRLNMTLANVPPELLASGRESSFNSQNLKGSATLVFQQGAAGKDRLYQSLARADTGATLLYQPDDEEPPTLETQAEEVQVVEESVERTRPAFEAYRSAWTEVRRQLEARLTNAPAHLREAVAIGLKLEFPPIAREPEFADLVKRFGLGPEVNTEIDVEEWLHRVKHGTSSGAPREQVNPRLAMERVGALLETFADSFLALRRGYDQFGEDMALRVVREETPLNQVTDHHQVLSVLLDWDADGNRAVEDLKRAFADMAIHQVALLHGFVEGIRHLFGLLAPATLASGEPGEMASAPIAAVVREGRGGFPLFRQGKLWKTYQRLHRTLTEEDRFVREVFGRAFARAYFHVTGSQVQGGREGTMEIAAVDVPPPRGGG